jgi:hypothetical protein
MAALQHIPHNHSGVLSRLVISGQFIAIVVGNRFPPTHNNIEEISRHSESIPEQSKVPFGSVR